MYVEKDIQLGGFAGGDFASVSVINQTFSQVFVREPSSMTLALAGLIGLWLWRRRRS